MLGKSALPMITSSWTRGDKTATRHSVEQVLRISSVCVLPAGFGITALAGPLLSLLFSSRPDEVAIATRSLEIMGIGVIFLALSTPMFAIMQAIGRADLPVKHMVVGSILKLGLNIALISVPALNIAGAAVATTVCYAVIFVLEMRAMVRQTGMQFHYRNVFIKPLFAALFSAVGAAVTYQLSGRIIPGKFATVLALLVAVFVYLIALFCLKGVTKSDVLALPGGKNIQKGLEKLGFML